MGNKSRSKDIMIAAGVPCIPGYHGSNQDPGMLKAEAEKIGFPVLLKAVKGGGGKGMRIAQTANEFEDQLVSAKSEARNSFGDDVMLVEKYIKTPRHIEVQIFADKHGNCVSLGERDCSIQRRHQKILEESPAPHLDQATREDLWEKARAAALAVGYEGAGTVEFIYDSITGEFFFMEMNTRLQVEHPVTEMVTGVDLVHWQFMVAEGGKLPLSQEEIKARIAERGWGMEVRIYAENPDMNFIPDSGLITHLRVPVVSDTVRIDGGFIAGDEISSHYDPMIAKLIVRGYTRRSAIQKLAAALDEYEIAGPNTNIEFLKKVCSAPAFRSGDVETGFVEKNRQELFAREPIEWEVFAQAALGLLLRDIAIQNGDYQLGSPGTIVGFGSGFQSHSWSMLEISADDKGEGVPTSVRIHQTGSNQFVVEVNNLEYLGVESYLDGSSKVLTTFFQHTRLASTIVHDQNSMTIFQGGKQYRLLCQIPPWFDKALGTKDLTNSVLAPMPCKILRVEVEKGQEIKKDQALVVIESMKMETVIRSPQDGTISKIIHKQGVSEI
ncbi:MAG: hypothetical protein M1827_004544 [Pycnora praestabilis]|nr:MAG: hypothetical protein M1827_004544 [Pycnora praestabilis]